jgi:hypothetical protein
MSYPKTDDFYNQCLEMFTFNDELGIFFQNYSKDGHSWREPAGSSIASGRRLTVGHSYVMAHHLAWRMFHGEWPYYNIKHRNGNNHDNRKTNMYAPGKAVKDRKIEAARRESVLGFLASIGVSEKQLKTNQVAKVRETHGPAMALDLEHNLGLITRDEYAERVKELGICPNGSK